MRSPFPGMDPYLEQFWRDVHARLIDKAYRNGRYHSIDYRVAPEPPLEGTDAAWADELLREAGQRGRSEATRDRGTKQAMAKRRKQNKKARGKRPLTAAQRRVRRELQRRTIIVFINGKQKRVPRPTTIEGMTVDEFIASNADPIWLHENELWEYMTPDPEE